MKPLMIAVVVAAALVPTFARADLSEGTYAPDIEAKEWLNSDEALSLRELHGMVVVLFFWVSWHQGGQFSMELLNLVEANPGIGRSGGVFIMGVTDASKDQVSKVLEKEKAFFPVACGSDAYKDYQIDSFPRVVVIDTNGKVGWSGWPSARGGDELVKAIQGIIAKNPPSKTHPLEAIKVRGFIDQAREALRNDDFRTAFKAARDGLERSVSGDALRTMCQDLIDLIDAIARERLLAAERELELKNYEDGVSTLREVMREFYGMDSSRDAKKKLEAMAKEHEDVKKILDEQKDEAEARGRLARAIELIKGRKFGEAFTILEDIEKTSPGDLAKSAGTMLERMRRNESMMADVRDHQAERECTTLLTNARSFAQNRQVNKAKELYREVIRKFPLTKFADEAAEALSKLP